MIALDDYAPLPRGESQYPLEYIETNGAIKLSESESLVTVGITEED